MVFEKVIFNELSISQTWGKSMKKKKKKEWFACDCDLDVGKN